MEGFVGDLGEGEDVTIGLVKAVELHFMEPDEAVACFVDKLPAGEKTYGLGGGGEGDFPFSDPDVFLKYKVLRCQNMNLRL